MTVVFGRPDEWAAFEKRQAPLIAAWPDFQKLIDEVVSRRFEADEPEPRVVFTLGRLVVEDFMEIALLAGNGYGVGGLKLLRSLFERTVTMMHLIRHPDETQRFLNYHAVHARKTLNHLRQAGGDVGQHYTAEEQVEIEARYQAVRADYIEVLCKQCGKTRDGLSWTQRDLAAMARDVGFGANYLTLAFWPTLEIHTTVAGMALRLEVTEEGVMFNPGPQPREADAALVGAHTCLALTLEEHVRYFNLPIEIERIRDAYRRAWPEPPTA